MLWSSASHNNVQHCYYGVTSCQRGICLNINLMVRMVTLSAYLRTLFISGVISRQTSSEINDDYFYRSFLEILESVTTHTHTHSILLELYL